jgi:hypothetical protein
MWRRITEELEPVGFGIATVHAENEPLLARKIGIHSLPCLILLMDGKASVYKETLYSVQKVVGKSCFYWCIIILTISLQYLQVLPAIFCFLINLCISILGITAINLDSSVCIRTVLGVGYLRN